MYGSVYGAFNYAHKFTDVHANDWTQANEKTWDNIDNFLADFKAAPIYNITKYNKGTPPVSTALISDDSAKFIYWLLYSNYGNSTIASSDEFRFKQKLFTKMVQYAPSWLKKYDIQLKLRELSDTDIALGTTTINNSALNPQTTPSVGTVDELTYINEQNVTKYKKGKIDAYMSIWNMIATDVTQDFVDKFKDLFIIVVQPTNQLVYGDEDI